MCGIVGFVGNVKAKEVIVHGLKKLEYRGYDSAGIALNIDNDIKVYKAKGKMENLEGVLEGKELDSNIGIGHTRWATHGEPSDVNAHPHSSESGDIVIVHNGIIENYLDIKKGLKAKKIVSETDTEIVAHKLNENYNGDLLDTLKRTIDEVRGTYALVVMHKEVKDEIVLAKKGSPIIIGTSEEGNIIASDIPAVLKYTNKIYILEDGEYARVTKDEVQIFDKKLKLIKRDYIEVDMDEKTAEKDGFDHFMIKEIHEQAKVIEKIVNTKKLEKVKTNIKRYNKIYFVACGTAHYAGLIGKSILDRNTNAAVFAEVASEFRYNEPKIDRKTLLVVTSQSGETADTLAAVRMAKEKGARVLSFINVVGSTIARESDEVIYTMAGPEIAVASTKAYTSQVMTMILTFSKMFGKAVDVVNESKELMMKFDNVLDIEGYVKQLSNKYKDVDRAFFLGRGMDYNLAKEAALKLKEVTYLSSEAYPAGELKHGPIALIDDNTLVVGIMTDERLYEKTISNLKEVKARGAKVLAIINDRNDLVLDVADDVIYIPKSQGEFNAVLANVPSQLFAYHMAVAKELDVDMPRNLAKSVTVE
ncbi:MAG: glutamine--fructose-6-phosphate transaminase (isomerizing) [Clostridia bacterium]|jgi:glucosamine--fructose-6-phosphate aminotransferase (isomerizing)|nr:glutamine--fructose-6-phosphate transaminase (isomerizing) [Clostridia bacterium]